MGRRWRFVGRMATGLCALAVLALVFPFPFTDGGAPADAPRLAGQLVRHDGRPLAPGWTHGRAIVAYLGFIACTDYCPRGLDRMASVLEKMPPARRPIGVFVTLEPENDSPQRLAEYLDAFGGGIVGVTGDPETMHPMTDALRAAAARSGADPLALLVLAPGGRLLGVVDGYRSAAEAAKAVALLSASDGRL